MRLYGITAEEIDLTISSPHERDQEGGYLITYRHFMRKFGGCPLKVVYLIEGGEIVVVTAYPLRKSYRR